MLKKDVFVTSQEAKLVTINMEDGSGRTPLKGRARLMRTRSMVTMRQNSSKACQTWGLQFSEHHSTFNQIETRLYTVLLVIFSETHFPTQIIFLFHTF
jgi:hypothetical protein